MTRHMFEFKKSMKQRIMHHLQPQTTRNQLAKLFYVGNNSCIQPPHTSSLSSPHSWAIDWLWVWSISQEHGKMNWPKNKIKSWIRSNQGLDHRVKHQWIISSKMVTCLSEKDEWNYLLKISFRGELWWLWIAQEGWLYMVFVFQKA